MNIKTIAVWIAVGLVLGIGIALPAAKVVQGVKTVTKPVTVKITNGESLARVKASFGAPAQVLTAPQQVTLPAGCAVFAGKAKADGQPTWLVVACG